MSAEPLPGPFSASPASSAVPPAREFGYAWFAYTLAIVGLFLLWPSLIAVVVSLVRRGPVRGTFLASHHRWLLRTFAFSALGYVACIALVFLGAWDIIVAAVRAAPTGELNLDWGAILTTAGAAVVGGLGMTCIWFWAVYRMARGAWCLNDGRPVL